jgi:Concanavalin A-like lectin/glucanases superfamily
MIFWLAAMVPARGAGVKFSSVGISGTNLVINGSGGAPNTTYYLLATTDLALSPMALWSRVSTNVFSAGGQFTNAAPIGLSGPQEFYVIVTNQPVTFPGLVAAYSFNEGSGVTVYDASGNGNNGNIGSASWTSSGKYGSALVFDGSSSFVTIPDAPSLDLTTGMTLEAWVNPSVNNSTWQDVIYKGDDVYFLEGDTSSSGLAAVGGTFYNADSAIYSTHKLPLNKWTFLTATYDQNTLKLYTNGVLVASASDTTAISTSSNPLSIGGDPIFGQYFEGTIDEVRVYNVALTQSQIQADMNTPVGDIPTAPGDLIATAVGGNVVNLSWTVSTGDLGIAGYFVERTGPGDTNFAQIGATSGTTYQDTGLVLNTIYIYRVRATDSLGDLGPYSSPAGVSTSISINPGVAVLTFSQTQQFTADFTNATVNWSVDGIAGGSVLVGTITVGGLYTPPASVGTHTVTATTADLTRTGSATVYVTGNPGVFTYHNDNFRTGENTNETVLTPANVNSGSFGKLCSYTLDGFTFSSPLYVANVNIPGEGVHNVVYAATEHDSVYAFDADGLTNAPLWQTSFINPGAGVTTIPLGDIGDTGPDIPVEVGITSTPVIDTNSGTMYVVAVTKEASGSTTNYVMKLHALDITTGGEKFWGPAVIPGLDPTRENQRSALLIESNVVYLAYASHGDLSSWNGWVLGYNTTNLEQVLAFNTSPAAGEAGIWMDGDGPAVDASGDIYFNTGNGEFDANTGGSDYGDSFIKLSPSGTVQDYFTPFNQSTQNSEDLDLSSGGVLLLPDQPGAHVHEMVGAGKDGTICLINRDNMGHYSSKSNNIVQTLLNFFPNSLGGDGGNYSSPVYYNEYVYFGSMVVPVQAFQLTNGLLSTNSTSSTAETYYGRGATMAISANGNTDGILWTLQNNDMTEPPDVPGVSGTLHAYDALNLTNELYNSDQAGSRDTLGVWFKFTNPVVVNGKVYVASTGELTIYGLLPNPAIP